MGSCFQETKGVGLNTSTPLQRHCILVLFKSQFPFFLIFLINYPSLRTYTTVHSLFRTPLYQVHLPSPAPPLLSVFVFTCLCFLFFITYIIHELVWTPFSFFFFLEQNFLERSTSVFFASFISALRSIFFFKILTVSQVLGTRPIPHFTHSVTLFHSPVTSLFHNDFVEVFSCASLVCLSFWGNKGN